MINLATPIIIGLVGCFASAGLLVAERRFLSRRWLKRVGFTGGAVLFSCASIVLAWGIWVGSGDSSAQVRTINDYLTYERLQVGGSGVGHLLTIDLGNDCPTLVTTDVDERGNVDALKVETWAQQQSVLLAINANFFFPFRDKPPWAVYPQEGDEVSILGEVVIDGELRGLPRNWQGQWLFLDAAGHPTIDLDIAEDAIWGVAGRERILTNGEVSATSSDPYPRTIVGVNTKTKMMWWLVVDGKQPGYSSGATLEEAAVLMKELGATDALEMDGGGSAILVENTAAGAVVLSRPFNQYVPGRSRVVANHIGVTDRGCT